MSSLKHNTFISGRLEIMKLSHQRLQLNQYGLPAAIFRPDLLPTTEAALAQVSDQGALSISGEVWDNAQLNISYAEGFPTVDGAPIWECLDFEPIDSYKAFQAYLTLQDAHDGIRALYLQERMSDNTYSRVELNDMFYTYYWPQRALAFDIFNSQVADRKREHRTVRLDEAMYEQAAALNKIAVEYMEGDEFDELMTPDIAMKLHGMSTKHQRIALGMNPSGPSGPLASGDRTVEISARLKSMSGEVSQVEGAEETAGHLRDAILQDEKYVAMAQELVVKITESAKT